MMNSKLTKMIAATVLATSFSVSAYALPSVTTAFKGGEINNFSDDFGDLLIDNDSNGELSVGDVLYAATHFTSFPVSGVAANTVNEFTLLSAIQITSRSVVPDVVCSGGFVSPAGDCASFVFSAPTGGLGAVLTTLGITLSNPLGLILSPTSVGVFLEDSTPNFTISDLSTATDGDARLVMDLIPANGDFWTATGPTVLSDFAANTVGVGIGSFSLDTTITQQGFADWVIGPQATGRGTLSRTEPGAQSPAGGDASFFALATPVPEPASLSLLGLGLLGMGATARRRSKK